MISYQPFFNFIKEHGITQYQLEQMQLSRGTLDSLRHNRNLTLSTIEDICKLVKCEPWQVFEFLPDENEAK